MSGTRMDSLRTAGWEILQDARYALRQVTRAPAFHAVVLFTLIAGIGLNTTVFTAVHALLIRPLAGVHEPHRLVGVFRSFPSGLDRGGSSIPHWRDLSERRGGTFDGIAAWDDVTVSLDVSGRGEVVAGEMVSSNFFDVLGVEAALGRTFLSEEAEGVGAHPVVVLSHGLWQTRFGGDPGVVGREIRLNGRPFEVVGVAPRAFRGPTKLSSSALWAPLSMQPWLIPGSGDLRDERNANFLDVVGRMAPGVEVAEAQAAVGSVLSELEVALPEVYRGTGVLVVPYDEVGLAADYGRYATVLMVVVVLLLLIACVNVANMFLARGEQRHREMAIRLSAGARPGRLLRQLLTENLLLALVAAGGALALAQGTLGLLRRSPLPTASSLPLDLGLSVPVLLFTLALALGTGIVFGLAPALRAARGATGNIIGDAGTRGGGSVRRLAGPLIVAQAAVSVVLLLFAVMFLRSLWTASRADLGFEADRLVAADLMPSLLDYDEAAAEALYRGLTEYLEGRPGVAGVSWADVVPLGSRQATRVRGAGGPTEADPATVSYARVGPRYFETVGIDLRSGRGITGADDDAAAGVVVVNEAMAEALWPGADPSGRTVTTQGGKHLTVVGVAADARVRSLGGIVEPHMYLALAQDFGADATLLVRMARSPMEVIPVLRRGIDEIDGRVPLRNVRTLRSEVERVLVPTRATAAAMSVFGLLGLLLSAAGLYGVVGYAVSRQTREIGIRVALGADQSLVVGGLVARGLRLTSLGAFVGVGLAMGAAGLLRELVNMEDGLHAAALVGVPVALIVVATLASWVPARRAARVDPVRALRSE